MSEAEDRRSHLEAMVSANEIGWWHSIDFGDGVRTTGYKRPERLAWEVAQMRLHDLHGKSVLDIGAWDGFFSFEAERRGAARVVALDHFVWCLHTPKQHEYVARAGRVAGAARAPRDPSSSRHATWAWTPGPATGWPTSRVCPRAPWPE